MRSFVFVYVLVLAACGPKDVIPRSPTQPTSPDKGSIAAEEQAAYERARPVFEKYCVKCHTSAGEKSSAEKLGHFNMDRYPFGGEHATSAGATVRKALGVDGAKATMPADAPGAVTGEELDAIVAWSHAFDRSHAAGLHDHGEHGEHGEHGGHDHGGHH